ncbi:carbon-nitrogen hydrolase family protein [Calidifontibacter sp. DB0510]|uniref:Carbon-nitrogen hydrolase family protein n=1 Tax=Metallococcus carri TaxID=1656884 RepID=A0A967B4S5_9MICO|nr:carbon-nitrogen hydrolase family protein [Metallococcus carri]NHN55617.1 carbon-nitrogen hydrolase family protein [Metallococcus carri]NOP38199.1 carbon-nitrogen hydrolase family protein [Calidifontibacter sp. DB2511S]
MTLSVTAVQLTATEEVEANLAQITGAIAEAPAGTDLLVFPEASMRSFRRGFADAAQPLDGPFASTVREAARGSDLTVVVGMFTPAEDGRVHNTLLVTGPGIELSYNKIHLYDAYGSRESEIVAPGDEIVTFDLGDLTVGLATCYDIRFADQFRALAKRGAEVVIVPACWGEGPGKAEQWDVLTRARALDAQAWLVAAAQAWSEPQGAAPLGIGNSVIVDPFGRARVRAGHEPTTITWTVDADTVATARERIPFGDS